MLEHPRHLAGRAAAKRHGRQLVRIEEVHRVRLVAAAGLAAGDLAQEESLPAMVQRLAVAVAATFTAGWALLLMPLYWAGVMLQVYWLDDRVAAAARKG